MRGVVTFYKQEQGYGFIQAEDGRNFFVHNDDMVVRRARLTKDLTVEFEPSVSTRGLRANKVRILPMRSDSNGQAQQQDHTAAF